jgi:hypothetical protein
MYKEFKSDPQGLRDTMLAAMTCAPLRQRCCCPGGPASGAHPQSQPRRTDTGTEEDGGDEGEEGGGDVEMQPFLGKPV